MGVGKSTFVFTNNSITLGTDSTTINITRDNQSYSHKLVTKYGTIATLDVGTTSYTWKPTASSLASFLAENTGQKTASITVTLYTYNGSTEVGWDAHFLTVTLSETDGKPTLSVTPTDTYEHIAKYGGLVSGQSRLTVTATTSGKYGATVGNPSGSFAGQSYTGSPMTFIPQNDTTQVKVSNWGSLSIVSWANLEGVTWQSIQGMDLPYTSTLSVKATDSRGFTSTYYKTYTILPYAAPVISNSDVRRCDSSGAISLNGTYVNVTVAYSISSLNSKNTKQLVIKYKSSTETDWTSETVTLSAYSGTSSTLISGFVVGTSYDFQLELKDDFATYIDNTSIRTNGTVLEVDADGESVVFGDMYGYNILLRQETIEIRKSTGVKLKLSASGLEYEIPNVTVDCNSVTASGKLYNMFTGSSAGNYPIRYNGWLETMVYSSDTNYRFQRYTTYTGLVYERHMVNGTWGKWGRKLRQFVLFDNDGNSATTNATLSETAANFEQLTIMFKTNDGHYGSIEVLSPNGKNVVITTSSGGNTSSNTIYLKTKVVNINGTTISQVSDRYGEAQVEGNKAYAASNTVKIVKVVGWK